MDYCLFHIHHSWRSHREHRLSTTQKICDCKVQTAACYPTRLRITIPLQKKPILMNTNILVNTKPERAVTETRSLPFGKIPTEHMFLAEYAEGEWRDARIVPFADLTLSPLALCLHYGQTVFEGMKAFKME